MKFTISKSELLNALSICGKCVSQNNIVPSMGMYLLEITPDQLKVSATDGERFITFVTPVDGVTTASILLPASKLKDYVSDLADQPLTIKLLEKQIEIISSGGKCKIPFEQGQDFTRISHESQTQFIIPGDELINAVGKVSFACATDKEPRIYFQGVLFELTSDVLQVTATDAMIFSTIPVVADFSDEAEYIIFKKSADTLLNMPYDERIGVSFSSNSARFKVNEQTEYTCILIGEKYPAYREILPAKPVSTMTVNRAQLLGAVKRVNKFSYDGITLKTGTKLEVCASNETLAEEATENMSSSFSGDMMEVSVVGSRLIACLSKLVSENVTFEFTAPNKGIILKDDAKNGLGNCMLVMPVM